MTDRDDDSAAHDTATHEDRITNSILSGSTFERIRYTEATVFNLRATRALAVQAGLFGLLALILPLYALYPPGVAEYLPTLNPFVASPKLLLLGFVGLGMEMVTAATLIGLFYYRWRRSPLTEQQARTILDVQQVASGLALVTGGIAITLSVTLVALGVAGPEALGTYLEVIADENVFAQSGVGVSVGHLSSLSLACCLGTLAARTGISRLER